MDSGIEKFINDQLSVWPMAAENYRELRNVRTRDFVCNGLQVALQYNPGRRISSEARLDRKSISERPCFLCPGNRPKEQYNIEFEGRKGRKYRITLNPYPIFPSHIVVSSFDHIDQSIWHRYQDMLDFVRMNQKYVCFYNGPESGASAPDHMHFQGCPKELMPLQKAVDEAFATDSAELDYLTCIKESNLYHFRKFTTAVFALRGRTAKSMTKLFYRLLDCAPVVEGDTEPRFNLVTWYTEGEFRSVVVFRSKHRSHHYFEDGPDHVHMSLGCADMAGVIVAPEQEDFDKMTDTLLAEIVAEVSLTKEQEQEIVWRLTRTQEKLEVGIMWADEIVFEIISDGAGPQKVSYSNGKILYNGDLYDELTFEAQTMSTMFAEPSFILHDVVIGIDFHWERKVTYKYAGTLKFIVENSQVTAVNVLGLEDYLLSVISSEMKSSATLEFLKAHSVISRSWVMSQINARRKKQLAGPAPVKEEMKGELPDVVTRVDAILGAGASIADENAGEVKEYIKWFDHDDHKLFDVCADDHCQRYQGLTQAVGENVRKAIDQTWGLVLTSEGEICDCRFYKCCGGRTELFSTCWDYKDYPYLQSFPDTPGKDPSADAFCDTKDDAILSQVLNDYDLETKDFYSWTTEYSHEELTELVGRRSGFDFGDILALVPMEAGPSGRLWKMKVIGSKLTLVIGKELIIRRFLSESHLKSSAFSITYLGEGGESIPASLVEAAAGNGRLVWKRIRLDGQGWGHGSGLCQIGAAVMAYRGYTFEQILQHYYPTSQLCRQTEL